MTTTPEIDKAIGELSGTDQETTGWIYGQMLWAEMPMFRFVACRGRSTIEIKLMVDQVKRYRDGESGFFLIEMPKGMAAALEIENFVLTDAELGRLKRNIDTTRPW